MKKWRTGLLAAGLGAFLLAAGWPAAASEEGVAEKTLIIKIEDEAGYFEEAPIDAAFWEMPLLPAGQNRAPGTLTILNQSDQTLEVTLRSVELPYDNAEAFAYFDRLRITVCEGEQVWYDGAYSRINDADGLKLSFTLPAGGSKQFSIGMRCAMDFVGNPAEYAAFCKWDFLASTVLSGEDENPGSVNTFEKTVTIFFFAALGIFLLCLVLGLIQWRSRRKKR